MGLAQRSRPQAPPSRCPAQAQTERPLDPHERQRLADLANAFLKAYDMPGLSVAIMRHGQIAYADSFGLADKSSGERVTNDHLFRIASVSKPITSVGIFTLIEQGKLGLDDKVFGAGGILGAGFAAPAGSSVSDITVGQLLRHTGGGWSNNPDPMDDHKSMSQRELIAWTLRNKPLAARPGTRFAYSNFGYCVLGRVIEAASGRSYGEYIQQAVLARCGIEHHAACGERAGRPRRARGHLSSPLMGSLREGHGADRLRPEDGWRARPIWRSSPPMCPIFPTRPDFSTAARSGP